MKHERHAMHPAHFPFILTLFLALAGLELGCTEKASAPIIQLEARRDFGYTVGSIVEHRILIDLPPGALVDPHVLPSPGPVNDWLDLRTIRWSMPNDKCLQLDLAYLILKGVRSPEPTAIPPLTFSIRLADTLTELRTPEWPFTLMPIIPPGIADENLAIRGMLSLPHRSVRSEILALTGLLLAAAVCAFLIALRRGLLPLFAPPQPFTAALREFGRPSPSSNQADRYAAGLKRIHQAIDETDGSVVFPTALTQFLDRHPAFRPLRAEFEQFFQCSQRHFFASVERAVAAGEDWHALADFCRRCAQAERSPR